jgi:hypothetical protein
VAKNAGAVSGINGTSPGIDQVPGAGKMYQVAIKAEVFQLKTRAAFGTAGATNVQLVAPSGSTKVYICKMTRSIC